MRFFLLVFYLLLSSYCHAQIHEIVYPAELSKAEKERVIVYLSREYGDVKESDVRSRMYDSVGLEYSYWGFFVKVKLLKDKPPVELFIHFKDGQCNACHEAGITVLNEKGDRTDYLELKRPGIYIVEYDAKGTSVLMLKNGYVHGGGTTEWCDIVRLDPGMNFDMVYSKIITVPDMFISDIGINVTLTAADKSGYKDIFIEEDYSAQTPHKGSHYYNDEEPAHEEYKVNVVVSMKKYIFRDKVDEVKYFFKKMFKKKRK